jgi:hypothetical protein
MGGSALLTLPRNVEAACIIDVGSKHTHDPLFFRLNKEEKLNKKGLNREVGSQSLDRQHTFGIKI